MTSSELLDEIVRNPGLYIGHPSVTRMKAFIDGYEFAALKSDKVVRDELYEGFQEWVATRFKITSAHNWSSIIAFMGMSESGSFKLLTELWAEYQADILHLDRSGSFSR
jgi:hypothetical protein